MKIPLEDLASDIIGKAQRGLGMADSTLAEAAGIAPGELKQLKAGRQIPEREVVKKIGAALSLKPDALFESLQQSWYPRHREIEGLAMFNTPFDDLTVNSYLAWDPSTGATIAIDTGSDCSGMLDHLRARSLNLRLILLTHTHGDHIFDLDRLKEKTGAPVFVSRKEQLDGAQSIDAEKKFTLDNLRVETKPTSGHSVGGLTYFVTGLAVPVAFVGDAMFAGSMGGGAVSYEDALRNNREQILTLPPETILCPGHGPLTTVGEEQQHNPFFP
jgi:hydroxyacylglutathione hydrolase